MWSFPRKSAANSLCFFNFPAYLLQKCKGYSPLLPETFASRRLGDGASSVVYAPTRRVISFVTNQLVKITCNARAKADVLSLEYYAEVKPILCKKSVQLVHSIWLTPSDSLPLHQLLHQAIPLCKRRFANTIAPFCQCESADLPSSTGR